MRTTSQKVFIYDRITVFFKHTDYHGFLHPYNFLECTSYVREAFFSETSKDFKNILNSPVKMMTSKITCCVNTDSYFGDKIEARFTTTKIKKVSMDVIIRFFNKRLNR